MSIRDLAIRLSWLLVLLAPAAAAAHCQMPCGIYHDDVRFSLLAEDVETLEKALGQIVELSKDAPRNQNQIVRWITTKEQHADAIVTTLTEYFLMQRVKIPEATADAAAKQHYQQMLQVIHRMLINAMKVKQTTDDAFVKALHDDLHELQRLYTGAK